MLCLFFIEKVLEDLCTITHWLNGPGKDDSTGEEIYFVELQPSMLFIGQLLFNSFL